LNQFSVFRQAYGAAAMQGSFTPAGADPLRRYLDEAIPSGTPDKVGEDILRLREEIGLGRDRP
jgi:hypothetical protein